MKFLFTAPRYHTNQAPVVKGLREKGHEVRYFVVFVGATEDHTDCEPLILKPSRTTVREKRKLEKQKSASDVESIIAGQFIPDYPFLKQAFEAYMPDVVICREKTSLTLCVHALCKQHHIPCVLYDQEPVYRLPSAGSRIADTQKKRSLLDRIALKLSRRLNPDQRMLQTMRQATAFPSVQLSPVKYRLTGGPRDTEWIRDEHAYYVPLVYETPDEVKNRGYFSGGLVNLLFVGKYRAYKNIPVLLSALEAVKGNDNWQIVFVGQAASEDEKQYKQTIKEWIDQNGLERRITLLENYPYSKMREIYKKSDILILPSKIETYGMAIIEAMAHGLAVICSDTCGAGFCNEEAGGIVVKEGSAQALSEAISSLLKERSAIEKTGLASYEYVKSHLAFSVYYSELSSLLSAEFGLASMV